MGNKLTRIYGRGHLHFIMFSCYRRVAFLRSVGSRNKFVQILGQVRDRYRFSLVGYVVMPEHVHLLAANSVSPFVGDAGTQFTLTGADGQAYTLTQVEGSVNGVTGRFEYITNSSGQLTHQLFVPGGTINGIPIKP
jgi:hypothetical protein